MPLPTPNKGESKDDFMDRCMGNDTMVEEYPEEDQRYAVCESQWGKKSKEGEREYRTYDATLSIKKRDESEGGEQIVGHAAVFNTIAEAGGWFREQVAPGAFSDSIGRDDVRALFNHNPDYVLGRNKSGTLSMKEDDKGLWVEIDPPDTQFARDLMTSIRRGDISQMSFGFEILKEGYQRGEKGETDLFTLEEVKLWDVSPVTYPFYTETDVTVHSRKQQAEAQRTPFNPPRIQKDIRRRRLQLSEYIRR